MIPDQVKRSVYVSECSKLLGVEENLLHTTIAQKQWTNTVSNANSSSPISDIQQVPTPPEGETTPDGTQTSQSPQSPTNRERYELTLSDRAEKEIIYYLVRYGEAPLGMGEKDGEPFQFHVVTYIKSELDTDDLSLSNPLYDKMLSEYLAAFLNTQVSAQHFFLRNQDTQIVEVATDVLSDRYQLSRMFDKKCLDNKVKAKKLDNEEAERLMVDVPRVMFNYKYFWVEREMSKCLQALRQTEDEEEKRKQLTRFNSLHVSKVALAKYLGERIIN